MESPRPSESRSRQSSSLVSPPDRGPFLVKRAPEVKQKRAQELAAAKAETREVEKRLSEVKSKP